MTTKRGDKSGVKEQEYFKNRIKSRINVRKTEKGKQEKEKKKIKPKRKNRKDEQYQVKEGLKEENIIISSTTVCKFKLL